MSTARRLTALTAFTVTALVAPVGAAMAVTPKAPVNDVITAKQFPGFTVTQKPRVSKPSSSTDATCDVPQPAESVAVETSLTSTRKVSSTVARSTGVSEVLLRVSTWQQAHVYFTKLRYVLGTCKASQDGATITSTLEAAPAVAGTDEAYVATVSITSASAAATSLTTRAYVYRVGRDLILISPNQATATTADKKVTIKFEDTAAVRQLGVRGVQAALARLG